MSGFSPRWLALREPYDKAARNGTVLDAVAATFAGASAATVTDLGCGTGATMRAIAPCLPARQSWRLVDNDNILLAAAAKAAPAGANVSTVAIDLARAVEQALDGCDLVATSALLDLVSAAWLDRLVTSLVRLSRPFYAALSYDGVVAPARFRGAGFTVLKGRSDWLFGTGDREIQMEMLAGWAGAAREIGIDPSILDEWLGERRG